MRDADPVDAAFAANAHSTASQVEQLPAREGWPRGATSDDTALTLLVAHHLADRHGEGDPADFPADLAEKEAHQRHRPDHNCSDRAIPPRRQGYRLPRNSHEPAGDARPAHRLGATHDQAGRRRQRTFTMSQATGADPAALVAARVIGTCA